MDTDVVVDAATRPAVTSSATTSPQPRRLVCPDGHLAWRGFKPAELEAWLDTTLGRRVGDRRGTARRVPEAIPMSQAAPDTEVLVVGAGPVGLMTALELTRRGISVRIIDRAPQRAPESRALVVHARTLEIMDL